MTNRLQLIEKVNNILFPFSSFCTEEAKKNIVFVYTPPKVGSTSLVTSLRLSAADKLSVIHIHDEAMLRYFLRDECGDVTVEELIEYNQQIGKTVYVIDIYRHPIERKLSEFFDKICDFHFNTTEENVGRLSLQRIMNRFDKLFPHLGQGDYYIDKYRLSFTAFNHEDKYLVQVKNGITYIKLRLVDSNEWGRILTKLLKTPIIIVRDHETALKGFGKLYYEFKNAYKIPDNHYELIENDQHLRLYMSQEEREKYLMGWSMKKRGTVVKSMTEIERDVYTSLCLENEECSRLLSQKRVEREKEHYIDNGCVCPVCRAQRVKILQEVLWYLSGLRFQIGNTSQLVSRIAIVTDSLTITLPPTFKIVHPAPTAQQLLQMKQKQNILLLKQQYQMHQQQQASLLQQSFNQQQQQPQQQHFFYPQLKQSYGLQSQIPYQQQHVPYTPNVPYQQHIPYQQQVSHQQQIPNLYVRKTF